VGIQSQNQNGESVSRSADDQAATDVAATGVAATDGAATKVSATTVSACSVAELPVAELHATASRDLMRAIVAQGVMGLAAAVVAWAIAGRAAGWSALAGAGVYFIPNSLFALRLMLGLQRPQLMGPFTFFLGEAFKIAMALLLLSLAGYLGRGAIVWPALIAGLICTVKGYVLLLMWRR
jgi:ATP synthase protein I